MLGSLYSMCKGLEAWVSRLVKRGTDYTAAKEIVTQVRAGRSREVSWTGG
jgi:hypothetical protein